MRKEEVVWEEERKEVRDGNLCRWRERKREQGSAQSKRFCVSVRKRKIERERTRKLREECEIELVVSSLK